MIDYILTNKEAIGIGFGFCSVIFICFRIFMAMRQVDIKKIENQQRAKWQAEFFDRNHKDYIDLRDKYDLLLEKVIILEIHDKARG